ncbi:MAG: hypothetical protein D6762_07150 [Candidatus Neomarinimicrobiota bacterium]|nr:MAG: hypothetical protein D6762_07150 [Candidatus Neomarinimicrobiota bacterium]
MKNTTVVYSNLLKSLAVIAVLYGFLISIGLIGAAFKSLGKNYAETLIQSGAGPFIGLFIGILATSVIQSSSTTTSLVVGMVAGGTFGTDTELAVRMAVPFIMGANIGTSITNTLVSLGHIVNKVEFRRAFAASIIHDFFNILTVLVLFPLELGFGIISRSANWLTNFLIGSQSISFHSPLKTITKPVVHGIRDVLAGWFPDAYGWILVLVGLAALFFSLRLLTQLIRSLVLEKLEAFFDRTIFKTGLRAIIFGIVLTILVQSSSITTSLIVPLAGAGVLSLEQIFPYTLGANIGTTVTALLASLVTGTHAPLAVALSHLLFNIYGILLIYPLAFTRRIPLHLAGWFARQSTEHRILPFLYILTIFFILPLSLIFIMR